MLISIRFFFFFTLFYPPGVCVALIVCFRRTPIALIAEAISAVMNGAAEGYSFYE